MSEGAAAWALRAQGLQCAATAGGKTVVLRGMDVAVRAGEQVAVIGASGSGKTTLLHALACAIAPTGGSLDVLGQDVWAISHSARQRLRGRLFLAPQVPPLPPRQRVVTAVLAGRLPEQTLWQSLRTLWHPREAALAHDALALLGLADKLWERVDRLSGGERQRVGLARLLVANAELWLVDEPLSALDPVRSEAAIACLQEQAERTGRTLLCSLHQVDVARRRFGRIIALSAGQVVYDGPSSALDDVVVARIYGVPSGGDAPREATQALLGEPTAADPLAPSPLTLLGR